ncbi:MAG: hypothetical protein A2Y38_14225 [Spirochaetes bacterium GWB1_59_5]|nr:MAG: hypothetical protein A2Y38_14225 [Spirochaetes bacterium GWB1_59_5]
MIEESELRKQRKAQEDLVEQLKAQLYKAIGVLGAMDHVLNSAPKPEEKKNAPSDGASGPAVPA